MDAVLLKFSDPLLEKRYLVRLHNPSPPFADKILLFWLGLRTAAISYYVVAAGLPWGVVNTGLLAWCLLTPIVCMAFRKWWIREASVERWCAATLLQGVGCTFVFASVFCNDPNLGAAGDGVGLLLATGTLLQIHHYLCNPLPFRMYLALNLFTCLTILTIQRGSCVCLESTEAGAIYEKLAKFLDTIFAGPFKIQPNRWTLMRACNAVFTFGNLSCGTVLLSRWAWIAEKNSRRKFLETLNSDDLPAEFEAEIPDMLKPCLMSDLGISLMLMLPVAWQAVAVLS